MASSDPPGPARADASGRVGARGAALTVALVLAVVVAAVAAVVPASSMWARHTAAADRERLTDAAREVAVLMSSLSDGEAESSLDRLAELGTGGFRAEVEARREEVSRLVGDGGGDDGDDEVRPRTRVVASGVEQEDLPSGLGDGPARARLLVAVRSGVGDPPPDRAGAGADRGGGQGERLWRWRLEAVIEDGRALVSSAEVAV
ncbi:hypothetical protein [Dietzia lutea]|uniref:Uncharacterized protein n=1 Tax=Dietzia lutea TaxID=546160 RepID=A0A2S1R8Y8_9ACTN|nr:hypothetical protein [Dietzia lutea]AWH92758.1 hypothetical protein A6035_11885 [Dietzia lutea]